MRLNRIQLGGFKSFRSKSAIEVGDGITAIVGPNGCGKSNIVDAIRWAMGTQSARSLRGSKMADVIFAGSGNRKPSGFAEVELEFINDDPSAITEDVVESPLKSLVESTSALRIGRRLFRDGEGGYSINGVDVRLKDIRELFLGTGASVRGYSIIEQGQIEFLVNARPSERRGFVEELAGVTKYRFHRNECQKKLDATEVNLERLDDLIVEVRRYIAQLKHQSRKARRYAKLKARKRQAELYMLVTEHDEYESVVEKMRSECVQAEGTKSAETQRMAACETALGALQNAVEDSRSKVQELTEHVFRLRTKEQLLRQAVEHGATEREALGAEATRLEKEESELVEEVQKLEEQKERLLRSLANESKPQDADVALEHAVSEAMALVAEQERILDRIQNQLEALTSQKAEWVSFVSTRKEGIARLQQDEQEHAIRQKARSAAVTDEEEILRTAEIDLAALQAAFDAAQSELDSAHRSSEEITKELLDLQSQRDRVARARVETEIQRDGKAQALNAEVSQGARKLLDAAANGEFQGVLGLVSEGVKPKLGFEKAVAGILRDTLEYLVVDDSSVAIRLIEYAQEHGLVVGCVERGEGTSAKVNSGPESLLCHVELSEWIPPAIAKMLDAACLVDSLGQVDSQDRFAYSVDSEGSCCSKSGFWRSADPAGGALVRRARMQDELGQLEEQLIAHTARLEQLEATIEATVVDQNTANERCRAIRQQQEELGGKRLQLEAVKARAQAKLEGRQAQMVEAGRSAKLAAEQIERWRSEVDKRAEQIQDASDQIEERRVERAKMRANLDDIRVRMSTDRECLAEQRAIARQQTVRLQALSDERDRVVGFIERAGKKLQRISDRQVEVAKRLRKLELECDVNRGTQSTVATQLKEADANLEQANQRLARLTRASQAKAEQLRQLQNGLSAISTNIERLSSQLEQSLHQSDRLKGQLERQFGVTVEDARGEITDFDEPQNALELIDRLGESISRLGPINHAASEELQESEERFAYLCQQQSDLTGAIEDLGATINELDRASRISFKDTFKGLNQEFQTLFTRLFRGGHAELSLTAGDDPLESGVEVMVRPPGKRVRCMSLLSGGEKALTAIAMVFAAFRLKPSPFCVLDEVDAPLDEHNVEEFVELIREIGNDTQFLVITHNRRTMEGADKLVGVTMEEPGLSKLVTVKAPTEGAGWERERAAG